AVAWIARERAVDLRLRVLDAADGEKRRRPIRGEPRIVRIGGHVARVHDRRIVERPLNGIARAGDDAYDRRLPFLRLRRLAAPEPDAAGVVRRDHGAVVDGEQGPRRLDAHEELRAAHAGDREWRLHVDARRAAAQEVRRAGDHVDDGSAALLHAFERDRGVRGETQERLIELDDVGAALGADAHGVAGAENVVAYERRRVGGARARHLDR